MNIASRQRLKYVVCDLLTSEVAVLLFDIYRYYADDMIQRNSVTLDHYLCFKMLVLGQIFIPLMMMGLYYLSGYYNKVVVKSRINELITTLKTAFFGTLVVFFVQLINDLSSDRVHDYLLFLILFALLFGLVYIPRVIITSRQISRVRREKVSFPALIVGFAAVDGLREKLVSIHHTTGLEAVAYVDASGRGDFRLPGCRAVEIDAVADYIARAGIGSVVILEHPDGAERLLPVIYGFLPMDVAVYLLADRSDLLMQRTRLSNVTGEPLIEVSCTNMPQSTVNIKRVSDIVAGLLALALLLVPMCIIGIAVRLDSQGPVIYRQRRIGYRRRPFDIYKFRTMRTDAEADGHPMLSAQHDLRVTRVGRVLRKYRLDELPQFFNVVRGDMSIVGPRPEREYFIQQIVERAPFYTLLHQVRPGITSWGMVKYGYATSVEEMIERMRYDLLYIENISFAVDMKIIMHTVVTVVSGKGL